MEEVVDKGKACHKVCLKSKSAEDKHTLDIAKKEVDAAVLAAKDTKLQECTADLRSESCRKNCVRITRQMAGEGGGEISVSCMKKYVRSVVYDSDGMKDIGGSIWRSF